MSMIEQGARARLPRRRMLAFGAAALASAALAACGSSNSATETPKSGNASGGIAATVQAAASAAPAGAASTVQAAASQVPGGAAAVASQVPAAASAAAKPPTATSPAASAADVASRNGKYKSPPPLTIDKTKKYTATIVTNKGTMKAELYADTAPITVNNFVFLANDHFYDGVIFHRIVAGFVIQGGDPTGTGTGGPGYGYGIENAPKDGSYPTGTVAMARTSDPNSNGSQFFIVYDDTTLPTTGGGYSIFGTVVRGLPIVQAVAARGLGSDQTAPLQPISILSVSYAKA